MSQRLFWGLLVLASVASAQRRVDPKNIYHRVIFVAPYVGQGTQADPKRPLYAPVPATASGAQAGTAMTPSGAASPTPPTIIGYMHVASDDGKYAIVELVSRDMAAFNAVLSDKSLTVFVKGKDSKDAIETALRKYKKDFSLDKFGVVMP